jgi:hypothetical protein
MLNSKTLHKIKDEIVEVLPIDSLQIFWDSKYVKKSSEIKGKLDICHFKIGKLEIRHSKINV